MKLRGWLVVVVVVVVAAVGGAVAAASGGASGVTARSLTIPVVDGPNNDQHVSIDATLYTPNGGGKRPAVIVAHGFGGSKDSVAAEARELTAHGYVTLAYSARGFGKSTGQIALDSPDYEIKDVSGLIDWLAQQPEVQLDGPGDPRVGIVGGSYGGAAALLAAAYDPRVDAIVPVATWNNLATVFFRNSTSGSDSLAPASQPDVDGVFARGWAGVFLSSCARFRPEVCRIYQQAAESGHATEATLALLERSSPAGVLDRIHAPTLLIQGESDSLFGLDQADANARGIAAAGTPVRVAWIAGGHDAGVSSPAGGGVDETERVRSLTLSWLDHWLRGQGPAPSQDFTFARITSGLETHLAVFAADGYPGLAGSVDRVTLPVAGPEQSFVNPAGGTPTAISGLPGVQLNVGSGDLSELLATDIPGQFASFAGPPLTRPLTIVGSTRVRVTVASSTGSATLFAKLYDVDSNGRRQLPQGLVAPVRVTGIPPGGAATVTVDLPAVVHQFAAGHHVELVFASTDQAYATPLAPATYRVALDDPGLSAPQVEAHLVSGQSRDWPWVLAAAAIAVVGAAAIAWAGRRRRAHPAEPIPARRRRRAHPAESTRAGRRRHSTATEPGLAGLPLAFDGLSKTYGEVVAVDRLSFQVQRGQILGLLGPNGAGKTTALRMLMGLVHPTAGRALIFGQPVRPGARALSRIGSFIEGPGLLPHLSGLDNLRLYWRATSRPMDEAHEDEVLAIAGLGPAVHRSVRTYSQGMRQRLAIAQAMLGLPELLVLDEPTNGLDPPQIRAFRDVLRDYATDGRTVVISSHLLAEVEVTCSHVVVMDRGRLVAAGSVAELVGSDGSVAIAVDDSDRALAVARSVAGVRSASAVDGEIMVQLDRASAADVIDALVRAGVRVHRAAPRRRLEDAFVSLIGEEVR